MTVDEELRHLDERAHVRPHDRVIRDLERLVNQYLNKIQIENTGYRLEFVTEKEKPFDPNEQILKLGSEIQELRNQFNKYMRIEIREESISQLKQLVSGIDEINEIYAQHKANSVVFSIFYDHGDNLAILEKIVEVQIRMEKIFKTLNLDFRVLPYSEASTKMFSPTDLIYNRKETRVSAQSHLA